MKTVYASAARKNLYRLMEEAAASREPVRIAGQCGNVVLLSEEDWKAVNETLYLLSVPGMRESIEEGLAIPLTECSEDLNW